MAFPRPVRAVLKALAGASSAPGPDEAAADRRERRTEGIVAGGYVVCAGLLALAAQPGPVNVLVAAWLTVLAFVLLQIEFEVGEGRTRPVQLALVPMLIVLPAPLVPALIAVANVLARLPHSGRSLTRAVSSPIADVWFALGPAVVLCVAGSPSGLWSWTLIAVVALATRSGLD